MSLMASGPLAHRGKLASVHGRHESTIVPGRLIELQDVLTHQIDTAIKCHNTNGGRLEPQNLLEVVRVLRSLNHNQRKAALHKLSLGQHVYAK
jgi:hypothetical protein